MALACSWSPTCAVSPSASRQEERAKERRNEDVSGCAFSSSHGAPVKERRLHGLRANLVIRTGRYLPHRVSHQRGETYLALRGVDRAPHLSARARCREFLD